MWFISKASPTKLLCENWFRFPSIHPFCNLFTHLFIHPSTSPRFFTLNISPPRWVQVLSITSTHTHACTVCAHTHTQTLKYRASSDPNRRKGDGGSEISEQRGAEHVRLCAPCYGSSTPGELVLPVTSRLVALMLWLQCLWLAGVKKKKRWKLQSS